MAGLVTRTQLIFLATFGSAALMIGALLFQHVGGMAPCKLCIWQRYPHVAAIALGILALWLRHGLFVAAGAAAALSTAAVGLYHVGVEQGWWEGPTSCSSAPVGNVSADALFDQIMAAPLVRCDEIPWELFGLSMAGWNAVLSLGLAALWITALRSS